MNALPHCVALTGAGTICGADAYVFDAQRGGMVCAEHNPLAAPKKPTAPCPSCDGTGRVEGERVEWIRLGAEMRKDREARGVALADEAKARGLTTWVLREMEEGRLAPITRETLL